MDVLSPTGETDIEPRGFLRREIEKFKYAEETEERVLAFHFAGEVNLS